MTWQTAKADASILTARMLERIRAAQAEGHVVSEIQLAEYTDAESYHFLRPGEPWPWKHHLSVVRAAARILRRENLNVRLVPLDLRSYLDWLARFDLKNTDANRAQFLAWSTAPEPKPHPIS